jgi:peptide/nickel transport system permease protein
VISQAGLQSIAARHGFDQFNAFAWRFIRWLAVYALMAFCVVAILFALGLTPAADPVLNQIGAGAATELYQQAQVSMGLDGPLPVRFARFVTGLSHGDLGTSWVSSQAVASELMRVLPATLELVASALVVAAVIGVPLGLIAGKTNSGPIGRGARLLLTIAASVPVFWLTVLLVAVFARYGVGDLAASGGGGSGIFPAVAPLALSLALLPVGRIGAHLSGANHASSRGGRGRPLPSDRRFAAVAHDLRRFAGRAVASGFGALAPILAGTVLVEVAGGRPGIGHYLALAARAGDAPAVLGSTLVIALAVVAALALADLGRLDEATRSTDRAAVEAPERLGQLLRSPAAVVGALLLMLLLAAAMLSPAIAPEMLSGLSGSGYLLPPSALHWLGTDALNRDVLASLVAGALPSLGLPALAVLGGTVLGLLVGLLAAFGDGPVDRILMWLAHLTAALPRLVLALAVLALCGANLFSEVTVLAATGWMGVAQRTRGEAAAIRGSDFYAAGKMAGLSWWRRFVGQVLPLVLRRVAPVSLVDMGAAIVLVAGLSYLGVGATAAVPDWGRLLAAAGPMALANWWVVAALGLAVFWACLSFGLLATGLGSRWRGANAMPVRSGVRREARLRPLQQVPGVEGAGP